MRCGHRRCRWRSTPIQRHAHVSEFEKNRCRNAQYHRLGWKGQDLQRYGGCLLLTVIVHGRLRCCSLDLGQGARQECQHALTEGIEHSGSLLCRDRQRFLVGRENILTEQL